MIFLFLSTAWIVFFIVVLHENRLRQQGTSAPRLNKFLIGVAEGSMTVLYIFNLITNGDLANGSATLLAFVALGLYHFAMPTLRGRNNLSALKKVTIAMWSLAIFSFLVQFVHLIIRVVIPVFVTYNYGYYPY